MIAAHRARKIRLKVRAWVILFTLVAITVQTLNVNTLGLVVDPDLHAYVRVAFSSSSPAFFFAFVLVLNLFLFLRAF